MKKIPLLLITVMFLLTSCSSGGVKTGFFKSDYKVASDTFKQVYSAIQNHDETALKNLFSKKVQNEAKGFDDSTAKFLDFFQGKVTSFEDLQGTSGDRDFEDGKRRVKILSIYDVTTSEQKYHIAINVCIADDFDPNNVGIESLYIINAKNWHEDYCYRGDGKWTPGIVIDQGK